MSLLNGNPYGYYTVGEQHYLNKVEAVYNASITNQEVSWDFHHDIFTKMDWTKRPHGTVLEAYKERAQQIRDKYDYVIVHFSGGMDSFTVLDSFLSNGIHVDEVFTRWSHTVRKYKDADPNDLDESNLGSEFEYAVMPVLDYIQKHYPSVNIVIDDISEHLEQDFQEDDIFLSNQYQSMSTFFRFNRKSEKELEQVKQGKRIGVVYGYDKIRCHVYQGNFYAYFRDNIGGVDTDPTRNVELFYWTRDMPQLPILQAHTLKEYIQNNIVFTDLDRPMTGKLSYQEYREIYQQACYPAYNIDTFQVDKALGSLVWKSDFWVVKHNPRYFQSWRWATNQFLNKINSQYINKLNGMPVGLKPFVSHRFLVAENVKMPDFDWFKPDKVST
jgi:hypothetical protein